MPRELLRRFISKFAKKSAETDNNLVDVPQLFKLWLQKFGKEATAVYDENYDYYNEPALAILRMKDNHPILIYVKNDHQALYYSPYETYAFYISIYRLETFIQECNSLAVFDMIMRDANDTIH